jgi:hypothetical protein
MARRNGAGASAPVFRKATPADSLLPRNGRRRVGAGTRRATILHGQGDDAMEIRT